MRRAVLICALILLIFCLGGCIVISSEEHSCVKQPDDGCIPASQT
ncbi:MAG: hypothetical protein ACYTFW_08915 [Planctomycetota bacterium]